VSASEDGTIRIWDAATGESLRALHDHNAEVYGLALYPNGKLLASCSEDGTFRLWDIESGKSLAVLKHDEGNTVLMAAFSADGKQLASCGYRGVIFLRDPATGKILDQIETRSIQSVAFSPTGKTIAAVSNYAELDIYDLAARNVKKIKAKRGGSSVAYSPDGKFIAAAFDEDLLIVDAATNRVLRELPGHWNSRGQVVFSPDSRYLTSVTDGWGDKADRSIRVFEMASGTEIHSFKREQPIYAAAFSPDGTKMAVGGSDATALILDLKNLTGKERRARLSDKELAACWESLTASDASKAYEARADLLHAAESTVPFFAKRLQPAPAIDSKVVDALFKKLDSDNFKERDEASRDLEMLGELVREPMRKVLAGDPAIEARQRLQVLLAKLDQLSPSQLRQVRAIEILEIIGTPGALAIIERLAKGNPDGLATTESKAVIARKLKKSEPLPPMPVARVSAPAEVLPAGPVLPDLEGDPMPGGAIARLGSARWRVSSPPQRIMVSQDGKTLAVVNSLSGIELFDAQTGKNIERAKSGYFGWIVDLRMAVILSPDWQKIAGLEADDSSSVLSVFARDKADKVKIVYHRKQEDHPVIPEEIESSGSPSGFTIEYLSAVGFAPDGKTLVGAVRFEWESSSWRTKAKAELKETHLVAWDALTGKEIWKRLVSGKATRVILFSPNGKTMTVMDETGIAFWDPTMGKELSRWKSSDPLFSACYSPDRKWFATGSKDSILLWEVATGKIKRRLKVAGDEIKAIAFRPDGKLLAGGGDKMIRFFDPLTGKLSFELTLNEGASPVETVAFSADGQTLFSGHGRENVVRRWDMAGRKPIGEFNSPTEPVRMLSFSRDSRTILSTAAGKGFYLWEAETGKPLPLPSKDDDALMIDWLASSGQASLLRCEDGVGSQFAMLLTGKLDRLEQIPGFLGSSVDGQRVLVQTEKGEKQYLVVLKLTGDKAKGKDKAKDKDNVMDEIEREFVWKDGKEVRAALSPDGKTVAAAGKDVIYFIDVKTGKERRHEHPTNVEPELLFRTMSVKFSADGSRIALIGAGGKIRVLAVKDGRQIAELATNRTPTGLAFSPDGQTLLTTTFGGPTMIWEIATGQAVRKLDNATYFYSPDNCLLGGLDRSLKIYDLYSGQVIRECKAEGNALSDCAFSPNGKLLAASCSDTSVLVWPTSAVVDAKAGKRFDEKILAEVLEKGNAADAYQAIGRLIAHPEPTLSFLERRLRPMTKNGPQGDAEEKQPIISPDDILHLRAIQALERIGTKRAGQLLQNLAQGAELSPRTRAAVDALRRMEVR
jgi:WD40 repeat protein